MIIDYENGNEFLKENLEFLNTNEYLATFFKLNAPSILSKSKSNYAIKCENNGYKLVTLRMQPYSTLFFGDLECINEIVSYLIKNKYELNNYLCELSLGNKLSDVLLNEYQLDFYEALAMDFMKATQISEPSSYEIITANYEDIDDIIQCINMFSSECGLNNNVSKEKILQEISSYRVIKKDGKIASMAKIAPSTSHDLKISEVYTKKEYRGLGLARKVVNTVKNEIIGCGKNATLNVDKHNPITNHLYTSLGFKRLFSQSEFRKR